MKNGYQPKDNGKPLYPPTTGSRVYSPKYEDVEDDPMAFQEALDRLSNGLFILARKNGKQAMHKTLLSACVALEKQIPKKPKDIVYRDNPFMPFFGKCISCGEWADSSDKYCKKCGQRLDWWSI